MAKILSCLKKRDLLHSPNVAGEEIAQYGWEYFKQDRLVDALDFFEKAKDLEGIRRIMERSIEEGDYFLLQQSSKILKETVPETVWRMVGGKALASGRVQQALMAFKTISDENKIQEIQSLLK
jgi:hypothetical protein